MTETTTDHDSTHTASTQAVSTQAAQETGITDADTFDAFIREYPPAHLFTQFFPDPADPRLVLTRAAIYVPFTARVTSPTKGPEVIQGALTCVLGNVNQPDNQVVRSWMDVDDHGLNRLATPDTAQYQERMPSVGQWLPGDYPARVARAGRAWGRQRAGTRGRALAGDRPDDTRRPTPTTPQHPNPPRPRPIPWAIMQTLVATPGGDARITRHPARPQRGRRALLALGHGAGGGIKPPTSRPSRARCPPRASRSPWSSNPGGSPGGSSGPRRRRWTPPGCPWPNTCASRPGPYR